MMIMYVYIGIEVGFLPVSIRGMNCIKALQTIRALNNIITHVLLFPSKFQET
jgi:hypothetical protein